MSKSWRKQARAEGIRLGLLSTDFLAAEDSEKFLEKRGPSEPLSHKTVMTCLSSIKRFDAFL